MNHITRRMAQKGYHSGTDAVAGILFFGWHAVLKLHCAHAPALENRTRTDCQSKHPERKRHPRKRGSGAIQQPRDTSAFIRRDCAVLRKPGTSDTKSSSVYIGTCRNGRTNTSPLPSLPTPRSRNPRSVHNIYALLAALCVADLRRL